MRSAPPSIPIPRPDVPDIPPVTGFENYQPSMPSPGQEKAAGEILSGASALLDPLLAGGAVARPVAMAAQLGAGYLTGKLARKAAAATGASPEAQDLAEQVGFWAPVAGATLLRPRFGVVSQPDVTAIGGEAVGGEVAGGVAKTPAGVTVAGRAGPFRFQKTFGGKPEVPAIEPQTIRGEPGAVAAPPPPPAGFDQEVPVQAAQAALAAPAAVTPTGQPIALHGEAMAKPEAIHEAAKAQQPELVKAAQSIAAQVPGAKVVNPGAKSTEAIERKQDAGRPVTDAVRAQVGVPDQAAKQQAVQAIAQQLPVTEIGPTEAKDLPIIAAKLPGSQEIQVATKEEAKTQEETHPLYAKIQEAKAARNDVKAEQLQGELNQKLAEAKAE